MHLFPPSKPLSLLGSVLCGLLAVSCSGGGGGDSSTPPSGGGGPVTSGFQLTRVSVQNNAVWKLNRPIELTFSAAVDFSTVSSNTINIQSTSGVPATGTFFFKPTPNGGTDPSTIVFQPTCPTKSDLSDAGLKPGGVEYVLEVIGLSSNATNTVRSLGGSLLRDTQIRRFTTPVSTNPATAFEDTTLGPPAPVVRTKGSAAQAGVSYMEIGGDTDPDTHLYFEFDPLTQTYSVVPGPAATSNEAPLNLYSDGETAVAVLVEFNQAVNPSVSNVSSDRLRLEFMDMGGMWQPLETRVELVANCTGTGATVRLEPIGLLPAGSQFRTVVLPGFEDIVGQTNLLAAEDFAVADTQALDFASLTPANFGGDGFVEQFLFGGSHPDSFEDTEALLASPPADWKDGKLTAAFSFEYDSNVAEDFDWVIRTGEKVVFDTTATSIIGLKNGAPQYIQNTRDGVVYVNDLTIEAGGTLSVQGPNPLRINALGDVRIEGRLDLGGFAAKNVATLNTGNQPEVGGAGVAGSGAGGRASEVVTNSTPRGGRGGGPFGESGTGGEGGESGFAAANLGKDARRPGGGGGGRFAADQDSAFPPNNPPFNIGLPPGSPSQAATAGFDGNPSSRGALTGLSPAAGGQPGRGPFVDGDSTNDFYGTRPVTDAGGNLVGLIRGELTRLWAGYGGGGGGDALPSNRFPSPKWNPGSDEKGGGGGAGGGALRIRALGKIVFGAQGRIASDGARGGAGENTIFLDHVGGTGGSGSGGHIVLESATQIDFTGEGANAAGPQTKILDAEGAPGYVGPLARGVPTQMSHGGSGGPGVIQLHVPNPTVPPGSDYTAVGPNDPDIIVPMGALSSSDPLDYVSSPIALTMIPTFGARSQGRSKWISLGGADQKAGGLPDPLVFLFGGTDTTPGSATEGQVLTTTQQCQVGTGGIGFGVADVTPILGKDSGSAQITVPVAGAANIANGITLVLEGAALAALADDIYLRTPALLTNYVVRLAPAGMAGPLKDYTITSAVYDDNPALPRLAMNVALADDGSTLQDFVDQNGLADYSVIPRFFRVVADGTEDCMPADAAVIIGFQATGADVFGDPDEANILVPPGGASFVSDITMLNDPALAGQLKFFRYEVVFDLGTTLSVDTKPVAIEFLKIPFRF